MKRSSIGVPPRPCTSNTPSRPPRMYWLRSGICPPFLPPSSWGNSPRTLGSLSCSVIAHAHPICHAHPFVARSVACRLLHADLLQPVTHKRAVTSQLCHVSACHVPAHTRRATN